MSNLRRPASNPFFSGTIGTDPESQMTPSSDPDASSTNKTKQMVPLISRFEFTSDRERQRVNFRRKESKNDASGKRRFNVNVPIKMLAWVCIIFFGAPIIIFSFRLKRLFIANDPTMYHEIGHVVYKNSTHNLIEGDSHPDGTNNLSSMNEVAPPADEISLNIENSNPVGDPVPSDTALPPPADGEDGGASDSNPNALNPPLPAPDGLVGVTEKIATSGNNEERRKISEKSADKDIIVG